jgi:hypothetical protein
MSLKLRPGSVLSLDIKQDEHGFTLTPTLRVGSTSKPQGKVRRCTNEAQLWAEIEILAQDRLARLGLEKLQT